MKRTYRYVAGLSVGVVAVTLLLGRATGQSPKPESLESEVNPFRTGLVLLGEYSDPPQAEFASAGLRAFDTELVGTRFLGADYTFYRPDHITSDKSATLTDFKLSARVDGVWKEMAAPTESNVDTGLRVWIPIKRETKIDRVRIGVTVQSWNRKSFPSAIKSPSSSFTAKPTEGVTIFMTPTGNTYATTVGFMSATGEDAWQALRGKSYGIEFVEGWRPAKTLVPITRIPDEGQMLSSFDLSDGMRSKLLTGAAKIQFCIYEAALSSGGVVELTPATGPLSLGKWNSALPTPMEYPSDEVGAPFRDRSVVPLMPVNLSRVFYDPEPTNP